MNRLSNEYENPPGSENSIGHDITAKCRRSGCNWEATGSLTYNVQSGAVIVDSELMELCLAHHNATRRSSVDHNQFWLYENEEDVGFASVSSAGSVGQYWPS